MTDRKEQERQYFIDHEVTLQIAMERVDGGPWESDFAKRVLDYIGPSEHPYHEACPNCWARYEAAQRRIAKLEDGIRALLPVTHHDLDPDHDSRICIPCAARTKALRALEPAPRFR